MKLHIGCGFNMKQDYINIDSDPILKPDIVRDIERGLPFSDHTVEEIVIEHTLEHVNPKMIHFVMFEFWRVLKHNGLLKVVVPIGKGLTNSPEHRCSFDYKSYIFFTEWNKRQPYKFELVEQKVVGEDIEEELHFTLKAIKKGILTR